MLAIVDDQQQPPPSERVGDGVDQRGVALRGDAQRGRDGRGHRGRLADRRQLDHPHSVGKLARELGTDLDRQPGLADTADSAQCDQPVRSHQLDDLGDQILAADERVQLLGQVACGAIDASKHRELEPKSVGDHLVHRRPPAQTAEPMFPQRSDRHPVSEQHLGRVGHDHLAPVRKRHQPGRAAHAGTEVAPVALGCLPGVQTHPDRKRDRCLGEQLLRFNRRAHRVACPCKGGAEAITDSREHIPAVPLDRVAKDGVVNLQRGRRLRGSFLPRSRRVLDVGEQERHRAARQFLRHARTVFQRPQPVLLADGSLRASVAPREPVTRGPLGALDAERVGYPTRSWS